MNMIESSDRNLGVFMPGHDLGGFHHERNMFDEIIEGLRKGMEENRIDLIGAPPPPYPCAGPKRSTNSDNPGVYFKNVGMIDPSAIQRLPYPCAGYKRSSYSDSYGVYYENLSSINPSFNGGPTYTYAGCKRSTYSDNNGVYYGGDLPVPAHKPTQHQVMDLYDQGETSGDIFSMCTQMVEALLDEIKQEFEISDVTCDIDANDKSNPYAVVEYIDDLYAYYKKVEVCFSCVPNYMPQQPDLSESMRAILIDWLIELHYNFELKDEALYLTVNLVDRFLAVQTVGRKKLQLVGMTALLLACKYEGSRLCLSIDDLVLIADQAYSRRELLEAEKRMANALQFNLSIPTPYVFMRRFLKAAQSNKQLEDLSFFILDLSLVEYDMLRFPPSVLAAAAVFTSQCTLYRSKRWTKTCEKHTNYSMDQLLECSRKMVNLHKEAGTTKLKGVVRKYSTDRYGYVANAEPAQFLLGN